MGFFRFNELRMRIFGVLIFLLLVLPLSLTFLPGAPFNGELMVNNWVELSRTNTARIVWTFYPAIIPVYIMDLVTDVRPWFLAEEGLALTTFGWLYTILFYVFLALLLSWPANLKKN